MPTAVIPRVSQADSAFAFGQTSTSGTARRLPSCKMCSGVRRCYQLSHDPDVGPLLEKKQVYGGGCFYLIWNIDWEIVLH